MYIVFVFKLIQVNHSSDNTDRLFKVLLANYICFNFSQFPKKSHK